MDVRESPMYLAAIDGDIKRMEHLVEKGVALDIGDSFSLLHYAAVWGRFEVAEFLVRSNFDINKKDDNGQTAVLMAAGQRKIDIVNLLVQSGADLGGCIAFNSWTLLHYASYHGWVEMVPIIVKNGAVEVNAKTSEMETPLMFALQSGYESIAELLIQAGAEFSSCDNQKKNVLHYACSTSSCSKEGLAKIVKCIVERGETDLNAESILQITPLFYAVDTKKEDIAAILIQAGADPNIGRQPYRPVLHLAIQMGWTKVVQVIVEKGGCDLNPTSGSIPLHIACEYRNMAAIKLLISAGADVNFKTNSNGTALSYCVAKADFELMRLLVQHGAWFGAKENLLLSQRPHLIEQLVKDAQLCTKSLINKFNNDTLSAVYSVPGFREVLPQIDTLKINSDESTAAQEIAKVVDSQTKTCSNAFTAGPIVLKLICVKWLTKYQTVL